MYKEENGGCVDLLTQRLLPISADRKKNKNKSFTIFLSLTVIEHHASNVAVLCSRYSCNGRSFIIHRVYKRIR